MSSVNLTFWGHSPAIEDSLAQARFQAHVTWQKKSLDFSAPNDLLSHQHNNLCD